ncbi:MAG: 16S rRNA (guanine(966)-N(2))-methyltransferase RsmD [Coxiella endosymbiont of Dermacentor silvarum]
MIEYLSGKSRIIGGKWRGRKIIFSSSPELRPTADRIRETLYNWLSPYIKDAYCLDLFAGSGALGFEALSRGCAHVTFVDISRFVIENMQKNAKILNVINTKFVCGEFQSGTQQLKNTTFNIVFLDPPFYQGLINKAILWLEEANILASEAYIYIEAEKNISLILPKNWKSYREKRTTKLFYGLFFRSSRSRK